MRAARPVVVSLHRAHAVSGVSVAGLRLARLVPPHLPWRPLIIGADITPERLAQSPLVETPSLSVLTWPTGTPPARQCLLVRDRLRELGARVVVPHDLPHGFVAAALDHHRGLRAAALCHGNDLLVLDFYERCLPLADAVRGVNDAIATRVAKIVPGLPQRAPLPVGVPVSPVAPPPAAPPPPLRILYAGWLDNINKRCLDLAALADHLHAAGIPFVLTIAGDGPVRAQLQAALRPHTESGRARLLGPVPVAQMRHLHAEAHVFVLTSAAEGWPLVIMEALAAGRPVAITRGCGGAADLIRDGVEGFVVDVGDMPALAAKLAAAFHAGSLPAFSAAAHAAARRTLDIAALAPRYDEFILEAFHAPPRLHPSRPETIVAAWHSLLLALESLGPSTTDDLIHLAQEWSTALGIILPIDPARPHGGPGVLTLTPPHHLHPAARLFLTTVSDLTRHGFRRIALYGAGRHTQRLAHTLADAPGVVAVLDDRAALAPFTASDHLAPAVPAVIGGLPVHPPARLAELHIDAIVISSDEHERLMLEKARAFAGPRPVIGLYNDPDRIRRVLDLDRRW